MRTYCRGWLQLSSEVCKGGEAQFASYIMCVCKLNSYVFSMHAGFCFPYAAAGKDLVCHDWHIINFGLTLKYCTNRTVCICAYLRYMQTNFALSIQALLLFTLTPISSRWCLSKYCNSFSFFNICYRRLAPHISVVIQHFKNWALVLKIILQVDHLPFTDIDKCLNRSAV